MRRVILTVRGMSCRRGIRQVTAKVRDVEGVRTVVVDPQSCSIVVLGNVTSAALLDALVATGFDPAVIQDVEARAP
jgi:copper chaperone CopZ